MMSRLYTQIFFEFSHLFDNFNVIDERLSFEWVFELLPGYYGVSFLYYEEK